ncbi:MAG: phosphatase PAP2 family protein [Acidobacteriaceae bacterium]|nr:phosphatase PAP2 family protein [Acidobacteriaceae bacterium]
MVHGKHLLPVIAVCGLTAGLIAADQYDARFFRNNTATVRFNSAFSSTNTDLGIILAPAAFYSAGLFTKNEYVKETGLLSAEAAIDGEIADVAMKSISNRVRPRDISPSGNYSDSFFEGPHQLDGSFPSGHTVGAFAVATVVARRYGHTHRWVPFVAYALATSVGFSRVTESAHFPSDVFFGAAVGYAIARFEVLRH